MKKSHHRGHGKHRVHKVSLGKLEKKVRSLSRRVSPHVNNFKWIYQPVETATSSLQNAAPLVVPLNIIAPGTDETHRIGDRCRMHSLYLKIQVGCDANSPLLTVPTMVRVFLVRETTALGAAVSPAQFLNSATPFPLDVRNVTTRNMQRFHVYYDRTMYVSNQILAVANATPSAQYNGHYPAAYTLTINKHFRFVTNYVRGTAGTVADIDTNSLCLLIITDNSAANAIFVDLAWNLSFLDN